MFNNTIKNNMYQKLNLFIITVLLCGVLGCGRVSQDTLEALTKKDPSFAKILENKRQIDRKIETLKNDYAEEKISVEKEIKNLKKKLHVKKNKIDSQIKDLRQEMDPDIHALKVRLEEMRAEYKSRSEELKDCLGKLNNIKRLLAKKNDLSLSGDEISLWNRRIATFKKDIDSLNDELSRLRDKMNIVSMEIKILQR